MLIEIKHNNINVHRINLLDIQNKEAQMLFFSQ